MANNKIVVALGRNAFGTTLPQQQKKIKIAAGAIGDLVEAKYEIVITHSNGPQIGMIQTAMTEFSRLDPNYTVAPMSVCGAMSQGYIGYDLQNAVRSELLSRGIYKPVSTVITQVRVDPFDPAFHNPSKIIGRYMTKEEADMEEKKGNYVVYEIDAIRALVDAGQIVIAAGGGGIPVLDQRTELKGASAIIEKDYTAAKLADMLDASTLLILTAGDNIILNKDTDKQQVLGSLSVAEAAKLVEDNLLDPLTTLPKIKASLNFVEAGKDRRAIITELTKAKAGVFGKTGTIIS